jgi:hypothetical protein
MRRSRLSVAIRSSEAVEPTLLTAIAVQYIVNRVLEPAGCGVLNLVVGRGGPAVKADSLAAHFGDRSAMGRSVAATVRSAARARSSNLAATMARSSPSRLIWAWPSAVLRRRRHSRPLHDAPPADRSRIDRRPVHRPAEDRLSEPAAGRSVGRRRAAWPTDSRARRAAV